MNHQTCFSAPFRVLTFGALLAVAVPGTVQAAKLKDIPHPDFTKGDPIPEGATHDWTLGASGARGWI